MSEMHSVWGGGKEIIGFCIIYSLSFVLMELVVRSVDPMTSTFISYGLAALFFLLINVRSLKGLIGTCRLNIVGLLVVNITTLVVTVMAFFVMSYVSSLVYVVVFFSGLPFFSSLKRSESSRGNFNRILINAAILGLGVILGGVISKSNMESTIIGVSLSLISCVFASLYMFFSESFQKNTGFDSSKILAVRFFGVILICGAFVVYEGGLSTMEYSDLLLFVGIAITGSIVPLYFMQSSISRIGA